MELILYLVIVIVIIIYLFINNKSLNEKDISDLTDDWCNEVVINHNSENIYKLFCLDGNLVGTVSQVKRKGNDIKLYFDYFARLSGIKIISKKYNISRVTSNVFINTAFIDWFWDGLKEPITARMTFVFRDKCIFQLHSSALPQLNESLLKISNMN